MINGDFFVGFGGASGWVDRWPRNSNTSILAMNITGSCVGLFVDTYNRLYCFDQGSHQVLRNYYLGNINQTEIIAGNGTPGSATNMLNTPQGIFVDLNMTLYVADCLNNRVQLFRAGESNGITVAGMDHGNRLI